MTDFVLPETDKNHLAKIVPLLQKMNHKNLLRLTVLDSVAAVSAVGVHYFNLLPLWLNPAEAANPSLFTKDMAMGYGFWATSWAVPNYILMNSTDKGARKTFAKWSSLIYLCWWIFFARTLNDGTWKNYILLAYLPVRFIQVLGNFYFGFIDNSKSLTYS